MYDAYRYLFPPRPGSRQAVPAEYLPLYEAQGWQSQYKKNGTCNVIFVPPERDHIIFKDRYGEDHKMWTPNARAEQAFLALPGNGWCVLVAELLNNKIKDGTRNTNYVFDILVDNGTYLLGETFAQRQDRLYGLFDEFSGEAYSHYVVDANTWVAKTFVEGFGAMFVGIDDPEDEGVVLKDPNAGLESCMRASSNRLWSRKCRKVHKNFAF